MTRLRSTSPQARGWTRRRAGKGFTYVDDSGKRLPAEEVERIRSLAIPPAWRDVWICSVPNGHLQAVGTDDAGRRQYLYHPDWRAKRDAMKFDRILEAAAQLPAVRRRVTRDLGLDGMPLERAAAVAVRLLDLGYFRIGNDVYTDANGSFGLTTLERQHVRKGREGLQFSFTGKSGIDQQVTIRDTDVADAITEMRRRRSESKRVLAYRTDSGWSDLVSSDVNAYLAEVFDAEVTAKDFRTWHATVHAAAALATSPEPGDTKTSRRRAVKDAVQQVADYLGNTPTIAKNSYVDPRVLDRYDRGETISIPKATSRDPMRRQEKIEKAVRTLLS
ncbi:MULTISPECIES: DNA topoisomerase IB [unclassified Knoellia]|uniref:DNA topoisomerase IB n=1 Tax=Knoellia altitudinis TaxID=3404795 RepID=UPI003613F4CC